MELEIYIDERDLVEEFLEYLVSMIKQDVIARYSPKKYDRVINYLNSKDYVQFLNVEYNLDAGILIQQALENIKWYKYKKERYIITLDTQVLIYNTKTKLYNIIKMFEYGTEYSRPIPLFRTVFLEYKLSLEDIYKEFLSGRENCLDDSEEDAEESLEEGEDE